jgi:hypothetical protein
MPAAAKILLTRAYIPYRNVVESYHAARLNHQLKGPEGRLQVVYLSGFPRTGTTVLKYYFADYPGLVMNAFDPAGFFVAWQRAQSLAAAEILVDKSNHYILSPGTLFRGLGRRMGLCVLTRDPRDSLLSLQTFPESREVPRDIRFWDYWAKTYANFMDFASSTKYGERVLFMRYEDFIAHPIAAKRYYLQWLGLDTGRAEITNRYPLPSKREFRADKVHDHSEIQADGVQRWKEFSDSPEYGVLLNGWRGHTKARAMMETFGYVSDGVANPAMEHANFRFFTPSSETD